MMGYFYLALMVMLTTAGQLLAKKGAMAVVAEGSVIECAKSLFNRYIIITMGLTIAAPVFYILALKQVELSRAFAFTGLNYILVSLGAKMFFDEKLNIFHYMGMFSIFLGISIFGL